MANYLSKKFIFTLYSLAAVYPLQTDRQTDGRTDRRTTTMTIAQLLLKYLRWANNG